MPTFRPFFIADHGESPGRISQDMAKITTNPLQKAATAARVRKAAIPEPPSTVRSTPPVRPARLARATTAGVRAPKAKSAVQPRIANAADTTATLAKKPRSPASNQLAPRKKSALTPTNQDISLRAYFIAEKRLQGGGLGDETSDWVEAERQLRAERGSHA